MRIELIIIIITGLLIANIYYEGKYLKMLLAGKKYYQIIIIAFIGMCLCLFLRKHPNESKSLIKHANNAIKYLPIDKSSADVISPLLSFTSDNLYVDNNKNMAISNNKGVGRMMKSGGSGTKRSVSETKKKFIASQQNWACGHCQKQLNAWFEVDHILSLEKGGTNQVDNLVALCRECHGKKTTMENL